MYMCMCLLEIQSPAKQRNCDVSHCTEHASCYGKKNGYFEGMSHAVSEIVHVMELQYLVGRSQLHTTVTEVDIFTGPQHALPKAVHFMKQNEFAYEQLVRRAFSER